MKGFEMKEDQSTTGNDGLIGEVVAQLQHLGEMQLEVTSPGSMKARDDAAPTGGEGGDKNAAPKKQENPPPTTRDKMLADMIAQRTAKNGICTEQEKKALAHHLDSKVADLGEGCTADDLSPSERDQVVGWATEVGEDMLYVKEGMEQIKVGPVQRACQNIPFFTTPDYRPEPQEPPDPHPDYTATDANKPKPPSKPWTFYNSAEEAAKKEAEYEAAKKKYEEDLKKWEDDKKFQEEHKQYEKAHDLWLQGCKNLDEQFSEIEKALALGVMKTDYNPETGKYTVAYMGNDGKWVVNEYDSPQDAKEATRKLTSNYDDFDGGKINQKIMQTEINDDVLAAISTGDLEVHPSEDGGALVVTKHQTSEIPGVDAQGKPLPGVLKPGDGQPTFLIPGESTKGDLVNDYKGYQSGADVDYKSMDGRAFNNLEEKRALLDKCTTDEEGNRICSVCKKPWPEASAAPAALMVRRSDVLIQKLRYRAGYVEWEKVDAAVKLTKASLSALGGNPLTPEQIGKLVKYIKSIIGTNEEMASKFCHSLLHECAACSNISDGNVHAILHPFSHAGGNDEMRARALGKCPLCGQDILPEDKPLNEEITKAESKFKGDERTNADAEKEFNGSPYVKASGVAELLRDGTQQAFNPFIDPKGTWTKFSYRPTDSKEGYPIIRIVPASFQCMANIDKVLNTTPYVFVKEYFMRNNVSSAVNLFQGALEGKADPPASDEAAQPSAIKAKTEELTQIIKDAFVTLDDPLEQVITMPFVLYHRLKAKLYGNQYVFPYNPKDFALAQSSNTEEWGGEGLLSTLTSGLMNATNGLTGMLGFGVAKPFPAPTWKLPDGGTKWSMSFDLNLLNDEFIRARNNYMCSNTIINNNRWIQKTILGFPGALYEVLIPTGLRELMCTGSFTLKPLGVNRHVPHNFFKDPFQIGSLVYGTLGSAEMHSSAYEVVPDAYTLSCSFQSAIAENLNNSVFAYYLKITDFAPGTPSDSAFEAMKTGAPWATAAVAQRKVDDAEALQQAEVAARGIADSMSPLLEAQGAKAAAEDAKKQADAARTSDPPKDGGGESGGAPAPRTVVKAKRDILRSDDQMDMYEKQYKVLSQKMSIVKSDIEANREKLDSLLRSSEDLPLTKIRKTYSRRISKVNEKISSLESELKGIEDNLVQLEMSILVHAKDAVEERTRSEVLVVPRGYFDPYQLDEITALKIKLMTRDELDKFIAEMDAHLKAIDEWGIHNCKDFWIRAGAIQFIADAMNELEDLMRDAYEVDEEAYDKYRYRHDMLMGDLKAALDPSKPFIMNRTNIIYIAPDTLPPNIMQATDDQGGNLLPAPNSSSNGNENSHGELIETEDGQSPAIIHTDDGEVIVDRAELIKQHRAEVIKQVFKDEDGLAAAAFKTAIERYPAAKFDRDALVMLKKMPQLDDEADMTGWFGSQEGEMYANVHERMEEREDESVAIFPIDQAFDIHSVNRSSCIFYLTQDLYRYVSMCRTVLLGNAMDMVNTKSTAVLNRVTQQFQRLEN